ncbi:MAG: hypothetical protein A2498_15565 [Lentisphaerae bacterium RIFOXYC12_FULL_60_16]|nr:MAG: hypothetical protein A2498_15565 [Lentisphaerae bacterium RIFOXYC12_FULL_60_16]OGV79345.1 MAG: hypothetical protein A2340_04880 [Lentisphaerae bacterium RIFOXYB12_FULL_60_10]
MNLTATTVLIGFGNPGRCDDGLGPALVDAVSTLGLPGLTTESDYQLTVEDADLVAHHEVAVFADADVSCREPFRFHRIQPGPSARFSSHAVEAPEVMALAQQLFGATTRAYALGIRGYRFNAYDERISPEARRNLDAAVRFIEHVIRNRSFEEALTDTSEPSARGLAANNEDMK